MRFGFFVTTGALTQIIDARLGVGSCEVTAADFEVALKQNFLKEWPSLGWY